MEISVAVGVGALLAFGVPQSSVTDRVEIFALPYLNEHLYLMMVMSGLFGALRVIGAVALARNRMWGLALSLFNCGVTLVLMIFLLPPGLLDGILTGTALVLILSGWLQLRPVVVGGDMPERTDRERDCGQDHLHEIHRVAIN